MQNLIDKLAIKESSKTCFNCGKQALRRGSSNNEFCFCLLKNFRVLKHRFTDLEVEKMLSGSKGRCFTAYRNFYSNKRRLLNPIRKITIGKIPAKDKREFYDSAIWKIIRHETLNKYGRMCACCGNRPPHTILHVDHIKPLSTHWELRLDPNNLQVLCADCNQGKSNLCENDYRQKEEKE